MKSKLMFLVLAMLQINAVRSQTTYIENFDTAGYPSNIPEGSFWAFYNEIYPSQNSWKQFIPGDGNAYIMVDADISNDTDLVHPYQTMVFNGIDENHRLEIRMKGAVVDGGLVAFLFTYTQTGSIFNEVDIEVVAKDKNAAPHAVLPPDGWTDARFNTWRNADEITTLPYVGSEKAVVNKNNEKISLMDDQFHTYTIDWRDDQVDFFIDDVLQESFSTHIATGKAEIIMGYRNLPWAGDFNWSGEHTLVIDYFKIEPLVPKDKLLLISNNAKAPTTISIFPNPTDGEIHIKLSDENSKVKKMELIHVIGTSIFKVDGFQNKIDISDVPKGIYFLKTVLDNGHIFTNKILKL